MNPNDWGKSKRELQEPCEYCKIVVASESLVDGEALTAYIEDGILEFEGRGYDGEFQIAHLKINYCPMCGRKLAPE